MKEKLSVFAQALAFLVMSNIALLLCVVFIRWDIGDADISTWQPQFRLALICFNAILFVVIALALRTPDGGAIKDD